MAATVGYAVVGAGLVGPTHARFAAQARGAQLKVVCDLREDRGRPLAEELALPGADRGTVVGHYRQIQDMVDAVREGREPVIRGEDALHSLAVVQAIYEAERVGRPVDVRQVAAV